MIEELIRTYGLLAVFIGVALEGDATMILSGVSSHLELLGFFHVVLVGIAGAWTGDTLVYLVGRFAGSAFNRKGRMESPSEKIQAFTRRFGVWSIFASRFVYGTRVVTMAFWGYHRLSFMKYAIVEFISCCMWATLLGGLGYFFSKSAEVLIGKVKNLEIWLLISIFTSIIIVFLIQRHYRRKQKRANHPDR